MCVCVRVCACVEQAPLEEINNANCSQFNNKKKPFLCFYEFQLKKYLKNENLQTKHQNNFTNIFFKFSTRLRNFCVVFHCQHVYTLLGVKRSGCSLLISLSQPLSLSLHVALSRRPRFIIQLPIALALWSLSSVVVYLYLYFVSVPFRFSLVPLAPLWPTRHTKQLLLLIVYQLY